VLLSDFSLTAVDYMAGSLGKGVHRCGVPGYWAPEQASPQFACFTCFTRQGRVSLRCAVVLGA
jgi:hypothetical protein